MATTITQELQDSFLSAIRKSREITLHVNKAWVETAGDFAPGCATPTFRSPAGCPKPMTSSAAALTSPSRCSPASGGSLTTCSRSPPPAARRGRRQRLRPGAAQAWHRHAEARRGQGGTSTANACQARELIARADKRVFGKCLLWSLSVEDS